MNRLRIHDLSKSREELALERHLEFAALNDTEKFRRWIVLMNVARKINGGRPLKTPQGKGLIFRKIASTFLLLLIGFVESKAQLTGAYEWRTSYGGDQFIFKQEGVFVYRQFQCYEWVYMPGYYRVHKRRLNLKFSKDALVLQGASRSRFTALNQRQDSLIIHCHIRDTMQNPVINALVGFADAREPSEPSDLDGNANFAFSRLADSASVHFAYSSASGEITIPPSGEYDLTFEVIHLEQAGFIPEGTTWKFFYKHQGDSLLLKRRLLRRWTVLKNRDNP